MRGQAGVERPLSLGGLRSTTNVALFLLYWLGPDRHTQRVAFAAALFKLFLDCFGPTPKYQESWQLFQAGQMWGVLPVRRGKEAVSVQRLAPWGRGCSYTELC